MNSADFRCDNCGHSGRQSAGDQLCLNCGELMRAVPVDREGRTLADNLFSGIGEKGGPVNKERDLR
jgi:rubredoxin